MAPLLPSLAAQARSLLTSARDAASDIAARSSTSVPTPAAAALQNLGPLAARSILLARDDNTDNTENKVDPHKGVVKPQDINNTFVFVLFGLIGAAFVCTAIWFFFWAKNGGFVFKENDWEEYKSTVLRRKGPNGTILSGATPSTQLGGGSVYKDVDDGQTEYTGGLTQLSGDTGDTQSTLTGITGGASDVTGRERRRQKRERKEREREKKKDRRNREKSGKRRVGEDGVLVDEEAEAEAQNHLRAYRHEKPARVGGLNKESEGSTWDGSTAPDSSTMSGAASDLLSNRQSTPTNTPTKKEQRQEMKEKSRGGGIRKVYSVADRTADRENERLRAEAKRLALAEKEKGRSGGSSGVRRDYSFQRAKVNTNHSVVSSSVRDSTIAEEESAVGESSNNRYLPPPGGWAESEVGTESDVGTKSYHHIIPGISPSTVSGSGSGSGSTDYAEEKRRKRGAGRHRRD